MIDENTYFDGNVKSLGYQSARGKSTVGVMNVGTYEFKTGVAEKMIVLEGELHVISESDEDLGVFINGQSFAVDANSMFKVTAIVQTSYLCQFLV